MATLEYRRVIDAGPGWTRVELSDGRVVTMRGDRAMRNNNPGNIEDKPATRQRGAIGGDGRFGVFPNRQTGTRAQADLIFSGRAYRDLTLRQAIEKYAPRNENNTTRYQNEVAAHSGVSLDTRMRDIPQSKRQSVLEGMHRVEGNTSARGYDQAGNHLFTTDAVSPATPQRGPAVPRSASGYLDLPRSMGPSGVLGVGGKAKEETYAAPAGKVERSPLGLFPDRQMPRGPIAGSLTPATPLTDEGFNTRFRSGAPLPMQEAYKKHPATPPTVPGIDPKILEAYKQMAASRMAAPSVPGAPALPVGDMPPPALPPAPPPAPLGPPPALPNPVIQPPQPIPQTPMQDFPSAPAPPPSRPMDVYSGIASSAQDGMGNTVFSDPRGIGITNKYGATTFSKDGLTTASGGGIGGSMGLGGMFEADPELNGRSQFGNAARGLGGGVAGAAAGGLLGPLGSLLGAAIGSELAKPGGGRIGELFSGGNRGNFPSAPPAPPSQPNQSPRESSERMSERVTRAIREGKTGLY